MLRSLLRTAYRSALAWAYARRDFKLLLQESVPATRVRLAELASQLDYFANIVRPIPITAPFGRSMLVIAPHQDDEVIGCGGAMALQTTAGAGCHVLLLQDGADGHEELGLSRGKMRDIRNAESRAAGAVIGVAPEFASISDLERGHHAGVDAVVEALMRFRTDVIFVPWLLDANIDHRRANRIVADAIEQSRCRVRVLCYEVWGFCIPNVVVRIDDVIDMKRRMLEAFRFANSALDYTSSTIGMNMYRSRLVPAGAARYVEAFTEIPATEYLEAVRRLGRCGEC